MIPPGLEKWNIGEYIALAEREVLVEVLFTREVGIAFDFCENISFRPNIEPPHVIPTVAHMSWQGASFTVSKALEGHVTVNIKAIINFEELETHWIPYRDCGSWSQRKLENLD